VGAAQTRDTTSVRAYEKDMTDSADSTIKNSAGNPETEALISTTNANYEASSTPSIAIAADPETTTLAVVAGNVINKCFLIKTCPKLIFSHLNRLEI